jgi:hypothetical protein
VDRKEKRRHYPEKKNWTAQCESDSILNGMDRKYNGTGLEHEQAGNGVTSRIGIGTG